jgi:hypothetical protein
MHRYRFLRKSDDHKQAMYAILKSFAGSSLLVRTSRRKVSSQDEQAVRYTCAASMIAVAATNRTRPVLVRSEGWCSTRLAGARCRTRRNLCHQHMRYTLVFNTHLLVAPVVTLVLCAPKYVAGTMTLGDVMQAAAAFVQVQSAFNWLLDNYPRLAGWVASARRVGSLMASIDHLEAAGATVG